MSETENLTGLIEMGFSEEKARKALSFNNNNLQQAVEWLFAHADEIDQPSTSTSADKQSSSSQPNTNSLKLVIPIENKGDEPKSEENKEEASAEVMTANSLKCDDCGALLKDEDFATLHAHKTGHVNFSQSTEAIKPKTKEEIEEQKKKLAEKLTRLRQEKQEKEKAEAIEQEKARRKQGRQLTEIKQKFHEDELKRIAEEKRRDKLADIAYKQKVKDQIARDREALKLAKEGASAQTQPQQVVAPPVAPVVNEKKDYSQCKLQIRLTDGKSIVQTFDSNEQFSAVRLWIEMNRTDGNGPFNIMQTFPRKVYSNDDMAKSLKDLGLVPASSLVITK